MTFQISIRQACVFLFPIVLALSGCQRSPEVRSSQHIEAGKRLLQKNDGSRALLEFRNAVQATPRSPEAHYQLGLAYFALGDAVRAVSSFRHTLELDPKHAGAQLKLAQILAGVDDPTLWKEAQQRLDAILQDSPGDATALHALALTEMHLNAPQNALQHLERALAFAPKDLVVALTLAQAKAQQNDLRGAEEILKKFSADSPESAEASLLLAGFYQSEGNLPKAEEQLQRALSLDPKNVAALYSIAMSQLKSGRKQEAEANFKKLTDVPYTPVRTLYGVFLFQEGRREDAVRELERVFKQDPEDRTARTRLIAAYETVNRPRDAEKILSDALKANPKDLDALLQRGELSLAAGKLSEAELDLNRVLRQRPDSAEAHYGVARLHAARGVSLLYRQELNEVLRLDGSLLAVRVELAKTLLAENEPKAAMAVLDAAPQVQKNSLPILEQRNWAFITTGDRAAARTGIDQGLALGRTPDLLLQDAVLKIAARRFPEARKSLEEALAQAPADARLLRVLVGSYAAQNQVGEALKEVKAHAAKNPKSAEIQYFLGNLLLETGNQGEAKQVFTSAKALNPAFVPADIELARLDLKQANWTNAREQLNSILTTQENPLARLWMGMLEESVGNHDGAITAFRKVVAEEPKNATALNNLAYLLAEHGQNVDEALKYAQKAKEVEPDTARVDDTLGWVLYHKGVYPSAVRYLEMANTRQESAIQRFHLAMAYLKLGDKDRGRTALNAALRLDPKLPDAKAAEGLFR